MGIHGALGTALYTKLTTAGGTALWSNRVYQMQAPLGAVLPYVRFAYIAGGDLNISPSRIVDERYQVECVAGSLAEAVQGADYLDSALQDSNLTVAGWTHIAATVMGRIALVENVEGKQYFRRGTEVRVRVSS